MNKLTAQEERKVRAIFSRHYFCYNDTHTVELLTEKHDPACPVCKATMTYGRYFGDTTRRVQGYNK